METNGNQLIADIILKAYDFKLRKNDCPEWNTIRLVAEDESGEAGWEALSCAGSLGIELDFEHGDAIISAVWDSLPAFKAELAKDPRFGEG